MTNLRACVAFTILAAACTMGSAASEPQFVRLPMGQYRDRMKAGWIGQMVGVAWGAPTEFKYQDKVMPASEMPPWSPRLVNEAFSQDDLYVEMTFLRTLEQYGLGVSIRQAGIDFANSGYGLACANMAGRNNLRRGIAPPDSSHPRFSKCPNDIDYQIEADYSGLVAPGLPNATIALGEKFGRLMNYGDGMYAGQFVGAMYGAAFLESDIEKVVRKALRAIPAECQYAEMVRDVLAWYHESPDDWLTTWDKVQRKYRQDPEYQKASNGGIDCKVNGAYVLIGLLHGGGDPERTATITCRCGMDSDCNPSTATGVLFATMGFSRLPARFVEALDEGPRFSHTAYNVPGLINVCEQLARRFVRQAGGRVVREADGTETLLIPVLAPRPSKLELSWAPGPITGSAYSRRERARIKFSAFPQSVQEDATKVAPGWKVTNCGPDMSPGLQPEFRGRKNVLLTHPLDQTTPCALTRTIAVPKGGRTVLRTVVSHYPLGDWELVVRADGQEIGRRTVGKDTVAADGWLTVVTDLTRYAGRKVRVELLNQPTGWSFEAGYWAAISLESGTPGQP